MVIVRLSGYPLIQDSLTRGNFSDLDHVMIFLLAKKDGATTVSDF